jgi:hypothetical protein
MGRFDIDMLFFLKLLVFFQKRVITRVGAGPHAGSLVHIIAFQPMGAAVPVDPGGLFRQIFRRVHYLDFKRHLAASMLAVADFYGLPLFFSHRFAPLQNLSNDK